jgi:hypothetical protein
LSLKSVARITYEENETLTHKHYELEKKPNFYSSLSPENSTHDLQNLKRTVKTDIISLTKRNIDKNNSGVLIKDLQANTTFNTLQDLNSSKRSTYNVQSKILNILSDVFTERTVNPTERSNVSFFDNSKYEISRLSSA